MREAWNIWEEGIRIVNRRAAENVAVSSLPCAPKPPFHDPQEVLPSCMLAADLRPWPHPSLLWLYWFPGESQQPVLYPLVRGSLHSPRALVHSRNVMSKAFTASFLKPKRPSSSGLGTLNLPLFTYVPRKHQGEEFMNTPKHIKIWSHKHRDMTYW